MAYEVTWYHPTRVIYFRAVDNLTIDELGEVIKFVEEGVRSASAPIHLIVDVRAVKSIPSNLLEIKKRVSYPGGENMGWIVIIGINPLINTFVKVLTQLMRSKYQSFKELKSALTFLMTQDESLGEMAEPTTD